MTAADCTGGGPFVAFEMQEGMAGPGLARYFRFSLTAETVLRLLGPTGDDEPAERRLTTRPDGLRVIAWAGTLTGEGTADRFASLLARFRKLHPWRRWVIEHEFRQNAPGDAAQFVLSAAETHADLPGPADADSGVPMVRDAEGIVRQDRDEQMRMTRVWDYDVLVVGDPIVVRDPLRREVEALIGAGGVILRETMTFTFVREQQMRLSFETLGGGDGNALMNGTQAFRFMEPRPTVRVVGFSGLEPILLRESLGLVGRLVQTGLAVGAGQFIAPPEPVMDTLLEQPEVSYTYLNQTERQTTWTYVMHFPASNGNRGGVPLAKLGRPATPGLLPG